VRGFKVHNLPKLSSEFEEGFVLCRKEPWDERKYGESGVNVNCPIRSGQGMLTTSHAGGILRGLNPYMHRGRFKEASLCEFENGNSGGDKNREITWKHNMSESAVGTTAEGAHS
jgi:hypothetical protein